jgi:hypothetical protein
MSFCAQGSEASPSQGPRGTGRRERHAPCLPALAQRTEAGDSEIRKKGVGAPFQGARPSEAGRSPEAEDATMADLVEFELMRPPQIVEAADDVL